MFTIQLNEEYSNEIHEFIRFACTGNDDVLIKCTCKRCWCINKMKAKKVKDHLFIHGINKGYT